MNPVWFDWLGTDLYARCVDLREVAAIQFSVITHHAEDDTIERVDATRATMTLRGSGGRIEVSDAANADRLRAAWAAYRDRDIATR